MSRARHTEAEIIAVLKQVEARRKAEKASREAGVPKHIIYPWKATYGGMEASEAQEVNRLREENARLKKLVPDLSLDKKCARSIPSASGGPAVWAVSSYRFQTVKAKYKQRRD